MSFEKGWIFGTFIGINAGMVSSGENAFVGSIRPGIYIITPTKSVVISGGIYPTYIGKSNFGEEDFGESFQFISAIGIDLTFCRNWDVGYRF